MHRGGCSGTLSALRDTNERQERHRSGQRRPARGDPRTRRPRCPSSSCEEAPAGTLAAGRAAIARFAKLAPSAPGVYRMIDAKGEVLYVGKAKNIKKRVTQLRAADRPRHPHRAHDRGDGDDGVRHHRDRDRSAAARSQPDQAAAAALQRAAARRQVVSLHPDHRRTTGRRRSSSIAARARGQGSYYGPFASAGAVNRTINALQRAFLLRSCSDCVLREPHAAVPAAPDQALLGAVHRRDRFRRTMPSWCARPTSSCPARARRCSEELPREMEQASDALDFERAAIYRDRLAALSAMQSHQGINPRSDRGGRRVRRAPGRRLHLRRGVLLPHRAELGQPRLFPEGRPRARRRARCSSAFLAQFYDDKPPPRLDPGLARRSRSASCWPRRCRTKAGRKVEVAVPQRGEKQGAGRARARQCARGAGAQARRHLVAAEAARRRWPRRSRLPRAPRRIEVYDNSHIPAPTRSAP